MNTATFHFSRSHLTKGKPLFILTLGTCSLLLGALFIFYGYDETWKLWNIPTMPPYFADIRTVTGAIECQNLGLDPLLNNPCDPWGRKMNYPRIWLALANIGINQNHILYIGIVFIVLFTIGLVLFTSDNLSITTTALLITIIFSPAVLLSIERGNNDLLIFFLLSIAVWLANKNKALTKTIAIATMLFAFTLKLFPVFGLAYLIKEKRNNLFIALTASTIFVILYSIVTYNDLILIRKATPKGSFLSYGTEVFWIEISKPNSGFKHLINIIPYICSAVALVIAYIANRFLIYEQPAKLRDGKTIDAFRIGCGIYLGTFLLGSNWDYRLIFLLFTIPQLSQWASLKSSNYISITAKIVLASIIISTWYLFFLRISPVKSFGFAVFLLDQLSKWLIFFGFIILYSITAPSLFRKLSNKKQTSQDPIATQQPYLME